MKPGIDQTTSSEMEESKSWPRLITDRIKAEPLSALLVTTIVATFVVFFGFVPLFIKGVYSAGLGSTAGWAMQAWTGEQTHSRIASNVLSYETTSNWKARRGTTLFH